MNEPVAFWHYKSFDIIWNDVWEELIEGKDEWNPLYTLRELTDEEIVLVWNSFERTDNIPFIDFARAVLKCASEK